MRGSYITLPAPSSAYSARADNSVPKPASAARKWFTSLQLTHLVSKQALYSPGRRPRLEPVVIHSYIHVISVRSAVRKLPHTQCLVIVSHKVSKSTRGLSLRSCVLSVLHGRAGQGGRDDINASVGLA